MQTQGDDDQNFQSTKLLAAFWDNPPVEKQLQLLTIDLKLLHARAYHVSGEQATADCKNLLQGLL